MTIFRFVLKRFFRQRSNFILIILFPMLLAFAGEGEMYEWLPLPIGFQYYGILLMFIAARLASVIMEDRTSKILLRIGVAPLTNFEYLKQNLLAFLAILTAVNLLMVIAGVMIHGQRLSTTILLFIIYSFFSATALGFNLAWFSLFRNKEAAITIATGIIILMAMLGGIMWPIEIMPNLVQKFGMLLPTYWLIESLLSVARGGGLMDIALPLLIMVMFTIAFLLLGSKRRIA